MKNGIGLYIRSFSTPLASLVQSTTRWPRLSRRVKDSPHPKSFSPGESEKTAATLLEKSDERRMKENGRAGTSVFEKSLVCCVCVSSRPAASRSSTCQGCSVMVTDPAGPV